MMHTELNHTHMIIQMYFRFVVQNPNRYLFKLHVGTMSSIAAFYSATTIIIWDQGSKKGTLAHIFHSYLKRHLCTLYNFLLTHLKLACS